MRERKLIKEIFGNKIDGFKINYRIDERSYFREAITFLGIFIVSLFGYIVNVALFHIIVIDLLVFLWIFSMTKKKYPIYQTKDLDKAKKVLKYGLKEVDSERVIGRVK